MARMIDSSYLLKHQRKVKFFGLGPDDESWGYAVPTEIIENAPTLTHPNETPPCYQPDGDGCAYQCYDGDDEPIDKCKECPLCYSDKQRHRTTLNEPLTLEKLENMEDTTPVWWDQINSWVLVYKGNLTTWSGKHLYAKGCNGKFYRRPPEGEEEI